MEDKQYLKIGEALIGEEQIMEMAAYINHLETENGKIMEELKASKAYLSATIQQRNSATNKLRTVLENKINTIDITNVPVQSAEFTMVGELTNPEQWAVPEGRVSVVPKSNKL
jgi:predicted RNase H-like nuclease (RuvC/YqgF family)